MKSVKLDEQEEAFALGIESQSNQCIQTKYGEVAALVSQQKALKLISFAKGGKGEQGLALLRDIGRWTANRLTFTY